MIKNERHFPNPRKLIKCDTSAKKWFYPRVAFSCGKRPHEDKITSSGRVREMILDSCNYCHPHLARETNNILHLQSTSANKVPPLRTSDVMYYLF